MSTPEARTLEDVIAAHAIGADSDHGTGDEEVLCVCGVGWISPTLHAAHVAEQVREHLASVLGSDVTALAVDKALDNHGDGPVDGDPLCCARAALAATLGGVR